MPTRFQGRRFVLNRKTDVTGLSGTGIVTDGILFPDGQVVLSWRGRYHSLEIHPNLEEVEILHGHGGKTVIEWIDPPEPECQTCGEFEKDCQCVEHWPETHI